MCIQSRLFMLGVILLGSPVHAQTSWGKERETGVGRALQAHNDYEFVKEFRSLSQPERAELIGLLTTDLAGWRAIASFESALLKPGGSSLHEDLVEWLKKPRSKKLTPEPSFYAELSVHPASRLRFEKLRCRRSRVSVLDWHLISESFADDGSSSQSSESTLSDRFFAGVRAGFCKIGSWITNHEDACGTDDDSSFDYEEGSRSPATQKLGEKPEDLNCNRALRVSLALERGDKDEKEQVVLNTDVQRFLRLPGTEGWKSFRRETWAALERVFVSLPSYSRTLAQRLRVVDLAGSSLDAARFLKWRKLAVFLQARYEMPQASTLLPCEWLSAFYSGFSESPDANDRRACPKIKILVQQSLSGVQFASAPMVLGTRRARDYFASYEHDVHELYQLLKQERPTASESEINFFERANGQLASGLTSEFLPLIHEGLGEEGIDSGDVQGMAARVVVQQSSDSLALVELRNEKERLEKLKALFELPRSAFRSSKIKDAKARELLARFGKEARLARALLLEIDRRLAISESELSVDREPAAEQP